MADDELFVAGSDILSPLTKEEINYLFEQGSNEAREQIIVHNILLVKRIVTRDFKCNIVDKKDLMSIGNLGLLKAVDTFDISKGYCFSTYASRCIYNEIVMYLRKVKKYNELRSLNVKVFDSDTLELLDIIEDDRNLYKTCEEKEINKEIRNIIEELPSREKEIIKMRFGFYNDVVYKQKDIGQRLGIEQGYISKIIKKTLKVLKTRLEKEEIIPKIENKKTKVKIKNV